MQPLMKHGGVGPRQRQKDSSLLFLVLKETPGAGSHAACCKGGVENHQTTRLRRPVLDKPLGHEHIEIRSGVAAKWTAPLKAVA